MGRYRSIRRWACRHGSAKFAILDSANQLGANYHLPPAYQRGRTFITKAAKRIVEAGCSLRDIQELAGHSSLSTTQRYIQGDSRAKQNVVRMI